MDKKKFFQKLQKNILSGLPHFFFEKTLEKRTFSNSQWEKRETTFEFFVFFGLLQNFCHWKYFIKHQKFSFMIQMRKLIFAFF